MSFRQGRKEPGPGFRRQRVPYNSVATGCAGRQLLPSILFAQSRRRKRRSPSTTTTTSIRANLLQFRVRRYKYSWKMELLAGWTILRAMCAATCRLDCQGSHADSDTQLPPPTSFISTSLDSRFPRSIYFSKGMADQCQQTKDDTIQRVDKTAQPGQERTWSSRAHDQPKVTGEQMEQPKQSNSDATYTTARAQKATEAKDKADGMLRKQQTFSDDTRNETHEVGDYGRDKTCQNGLKEAITGAGRVQSGETQRTTGVDVAGSLSLTGKDADRIEEALGMARAVVTDSSIPSRSESERGARAALPK